MIETNNNLDKCQEFHCIMFWSEQCRKDGEVLVVSRNQIGYTDVEITVVIKCQQKTFKWFVALLWVLFVVMAIQNYSYDKIMKIMNT